MSIIAGLLCSDGIVIVSDSAATTEIERAVTSVHSMRKLEVIEGRLVLGVAGPSGISRDYCTAMRKMVRDIDLDRCEEGDIAGHIKSYKLAEIRPQLDLARMRKEAGGAFDASSFAAESLVALRTPAGARLFHVDPGLTVDEIVPESPFKIIGTGAMTASAFTEYLRQQFLGQENPDLGDGILTLLWSVRFAIATGARDVGGDPQVTLIPADPTSKITVLDAADIAEHASTLDAAERRLQSLRRAVRGQLEADVSDGTLPQ